MESHSQSGKKQQGKRSCQIPLVSFVDDAVTDKENDSVLEDDFCFICDNTTMPIEPRDPIALRAVHFAIGVYNDLHKDYPQKHLKLIRVSGVQYRFEVEYGYHCITLKASDLAGNKGLYHAKILTSYSSPIHQELLHFCPIFNKELKCSEMEYHGSSRKNKKRKKKKKFCPPAPHVKRPLTKAEDALAKFSEVTHQIARNLEHVYMNIHVIEQLDTRNRFVRRDVLSVVDRFNHHLQEDYPHKSLRLIRIVKVEYRYEVIFCYHFITLEAEDQAGNRGIYEASLSNTYAGPAYRELLEFFLLSGQSDVKEKELKRPGEFFR